MSDVHDWTTLIGEEQRRWDHLPWTSEGVGSYQFNHILSENARNIVGNMRDIIKAVGAASKDCKDNILEAFLEVIRALRIVYWDAIDRVERIMDEYKNSRQDFNDIGGIVLDNEDWQRREHDLRSATDQTLKRALDLRRGILVLVTSIIHPREDNNTIIMDVTEMIEDAQAAFETRASVGLEECISSIRDLKERTDQFRVAEHSAQVIEAVLRGVGSRYEPDEAKSTSVSNMQEDLTADVDLWLSEDKPIYFLCGEPGTGKTPMSSALCDRLRSGQKSTARLGASFFFSHDDGSGLSITVALSSIVMQLSSQNSSESLAELRRHLYRGDTLESLLHKALATTGLRAQALTVLVIDAIDQCKESGEVPLLLQSLLLFTREFPWLYIFLAARPRPNVMGALTHPSVIDFIHCRRLDSSLEKWYGNPGRYLEYVVPTIPGYSDYVRAHPTVLQQLIRHSGCDFSFACIAVRYLDTDHTQPKILFTSLLAGQRKKLSLLTALYLRSEVPSQTEHIRTVLRFVAYTGRGLTPDLISSYAPRISTHDVVMAVDHLRVGLTINEDGEIEPHDVAFYDFLSCFQKSKNGRHVYQMDRDTHFASISIAALVTASPVTAILQSHLPPTLLSYGDNHQPLRPLLTLWKHYLPGSKDQSFGHRYFFDQFYDFTPSVPLALYAWVTDPTDAYRTAGVVARFMASTVFSLDVLLGEHSFEDEFISEFYAFVSYVQLRRGRLLQRITTADVLGAIAKGCQHVHSSRDAKRLTFAMSVGVQRYQCHITATPGALQRWHDITEEFLARLHDDENTVDTQSTPGLLEGTFRIRAG
ncbi:AAA-16 domain-containing protein [Phanerochaete sordida]|uniref:AAA-16 domain-containing protein n=1 Tax=Phanerochaete sordida TaxID=48140 RepID=A0A9P3GNZ7_9APHY|nr:AAA-16 domain-containing protein [Phanerochaete sordida]